MRGSDSRLSSALVVEHDEHVRRVIAGLLEQAGFATKESVSGADALVETSKMVPDLVVLGDVQLPGLTGYETCGLLRFRLGETLAILFVSRARIEAADRAKGFLAGGDDYLVSPFASAEFLARVQRLITHSTRSADPHRLTNRENEILQLLSEGVAASEIATTLVIAPKTVAKHLERVLKKLGVHTRAQAVAAGFREGILRGAVVDTPSFLGDSSLGRK